LTEYKPDICVYHDPCADGLTAAWAIRSRWPDVEFIPGRYQQTEAQELELLKRFANRHVLIVDFSYKQPLMRNLALSAASITVLDHHKSAEADLRVLLDEGVIQGEFDMKRSGAMMAWNFAHPTDTAPVLVNYAQDRDLWSWELEDSRAVSAYISMQPKSFEAWDDLAARLHPAIDFDRIVTIGHAYLEKLDHDVGVGIDETLRTMTIGGYCVPVVNLPYFLASEAGNVLCKGKPFAASYFDAADGRHFSLRSDKDDATAVDVSSVARQFGGGGHANAAGFLAKLGWEGEP
jgi:oligoribonuclease NrnB/cAMP/cGMP phosphodiesterase (DHH superfamily)